MKDKMKKITEKQLKIVLEKHKLWLEGKKEGKRAVLFKADLSNMDLTSVNLSRADLSFADLSLTDLKYADLSQANLTRAYLNETNLIGANLEEVNLAGVNLSKAILTKTTRFSIDALLNKKVTFRKSKTNKEENSMSSEKGIKFDSGKVDRTIVPYDSVVEIAKALHFGAKKYSRNNYKQGMEYLRLLAAADRHLGALTKREDIDPESGLHHLAHAGACIVMMLELIRLGKLEDNRD
jgi:hypothetical protein